MLDGACLPTAVGTILDSKASMNGFSPQRKLALEKGREDAKQIRRTALCREAAQSTLSSHGFGLSSVRFICGTQDRGARGLLKCNMRL